MINSMTSRTRLRLNSARQRLGQIPALMIAIVGVLVWSAFYAKGGLQLEETTYTELVFIGGGTALAALAILLAPRGSTFRLYGGWALLGFCALAALTAISITWSHAPSDSWREASRTFSYLAVFCGGMAIARIFPQSWTAIINGVGLVCLIVVSFALATRIFPELLASKEIYSRIREPAEYWNAVGLMAALGIPSLLWLAARRSGHRAVNALPGRGWDSY